MVPEPARKLPGAAIWLSFCAGFDTEVHPASTARTRPKSARMAVRITKRRHGAFAHPKRAEGCLLAWFLRGICLARLLQTPASHEARRRYRPDHAPQGEDGRALGGCRRQGGPVQGMDRRRLPRPD